MFIIKPYKPEHRARVREILSEHWGSSQVVSRGRLHDAELLPGFVAESSEALVGLVTYNVEGDHCEIVTLNSLVEKQGIGSALVNSVRNDAYSKGCSRLWLITTNDNTYALKFYQKLGFKVSGYHIDAVEQSRKLKPGIPYVGLDGIIIRDEIELELKIEI